MRNIDVLEAIIEAALSGDVETLSTYLHEDFKVVEAPSLPYGGEYAGASGLMTLLTDQLGKYWVDQTFDITHKIGDPEGDAFVFILEIEGRVRKTAKPFKTAIAEMWLFKDGKAILDRPFYWDTKQMADLAAE